MDVATRRTVTLASRAALLMASAYRRLFFSAHNEGTSNSLHSWRPAVVTQGALPQISALCSTDPFTDTHPDRDRRSSHTRRQKNLHRSPDFDFALSGPQTHGWNSELGGELADGKVSARKDLERSATKNQPSSAYTSSSAVFEAPGFDTREGTRHLLPTCCSKAFILALTSPA